MVVEVVVGVGEGMVGGAEHTSGRITFSPGRRGH